MTELTSLTLGEARDGLRSRRFSAVELAEANLAGDDQAVGRGRLKEIRRKIPERLGCADDVGTRGDSLVTLGARRLYRDKGMPLERARRLGHRVDRGLCHLQVQVFAQLIDPDAVPL